MEFFYKCSQCGKEFGITSDLMLCSECSKNQKSDEPLRGILEVDFKGKPSLPFDVYDFLPVKQEFFPPTPVGNTPLWEPKRLSEEYGFSNLYIKDDTCNPTGSLKDRASWLVAAFARQFGHKKIIVASTGNAASSMAGIGAAAGLDVMIFIPKTAPKAKMVQSLQYGARVVLVDGNYDKAFDMSLEYSKTGGLSRNTAYNPMTIEGKKTVAIEIYQQLNDVPDVIFVPTGDGVIISGVFKGFSDLMKAGVTDKMPTVYCVQAEGSDAISRALQSGTFEPQSASTVADSISVDVPRAGYYALDKLKKYNGHCVTVSDEAIISAQQKLSSASGLFAEPAAAAAFAGFLAVKDSLDKKAKVVVLTTGNGLKDIESALKGVTPPDAPVKAIEEIKGN